MADRNDQGQHSDEYRPFDDPKHPSWYTDPSAPQGPATQHPGGAQSARNPYADQPLAGPYSDGQPVPYGQGGMPPGRSAGMPYPGEQGRSAALGITAMVLGIAGVVTFGSLFFPQVLAIVFGHISRAREPHGKGFALAGLIMGYLVTGLWILMIIGFMAFGVMLG